MPRYFPGTLCVFAMTLLVAPCASAETPPAATACVTVDIREVTADAGQEVLVPVTVDDVTGRGIVAYEGEICWCDDPGAPFEFVSCEAGEVIINSGLSLIANPDGNCVRFAGAGISPMVGSGDFLYLRFRVDVSAPPGACCAIEFKEMFLFGEGPDIPLCLSDGRLCTQGSVCVGMDIIDVWANPGEEILVPVEIEDVSGLGIESLDVRVCWCATPDGLVEFVECQAGDVLTGSGWTDLACTAADDCVQITASGASALAGTGVLFYVKLSVDAAATPGACCALDLQEALLHTAGNDVPSCPTGGQVCVLGCIGISIPEVWGDPGQEILIPVNASDLTGRGIQSLEGEICWCSAGGLVEFVGCQAGDALTSAGWTNLSCSEAGNCAQFSASGGSPLAGSGVLLYLKVKLNAGAAPGECCALNIAQMLLHAGGHDVPVCPTDGRVCASGCIGMDIADAWGTAGEEVLVPVTVQDITGQGVMAFQGKICLCNPASSPVEFLGCVAGDVLTNAGASVLCNVVSNCIELAGAGVSPMAGSGDFLYLRFKVKDGAAAGACCALDFDNMVLQAADRDVPTCVSDGQICVSECIGVDMPDMLANPGQELMIPISIADLSGLGIESLEGEICWCPSPAGLLEFVGCQAGGVLTGSGWTGVSCSSTGDCVVFNGSGASPLTGAGTLFYIEVKVADDAAAGACCALEFKEMLLHASARDIPACPSNGEICVLGCINIDIVDASAGAGEEVLVPVNVGDTSGRGIESFEGKICWCSSPDGLVELVGCEFGDVPGGAGWTDLTCTATGDCVEFSASGASPLAGSGVLFYLRMSVDAAAPAGTCCAFQFSEMTLAAADSDVPACTADGQVCVTSTECVNVDIPDATAGVGKEISIPVNIGEVGGQGIVAFEGKVCWCDAGSDMVEFVSCAAGEVVTGSGVSFVANAVGNCVEFAGAGAAPMSGSGVFFHLNLKISDTAEAGSCCPVAFEEMLFYADDHDVLACTGDGRVCVTSTECIGVDISEAWADPGANVQVPVYIDDVSGEGILAFDGKVCWCSADGPLEFVSCVPGDVVTGSGISFLSNPTANCLDFAGAGAAPMAGGGVFFTLTFKVSAAAIPGNCCALTFTEMELYATDHDVRACPDDGEVCVNGATRAYLDIKPGSCPNPINPKSMGKLPAALLGTADLDVRDIDVATVLLGREGTVRKVAPVKWSYEDVATPIDGGPCECNELGADGFLDLVLKFKTQAVVEILDIPGALVDPVPLLVSASLTSGEHIIATDCVKFVGNNPAKKKLGDPELGFVDGNQTVLVTGSTLDIAFYSKSEKHVWLEVFNVQGQNARVLLDRFMPGGVSTVTWDGRDRQNRPLPAGVYFLRLRDDTHTDVMKLIIVR